MSDHYNWLYNQSMNQGFKKPEAKQAQQLEVYINGARYFPVDSENFVSQEEHKRICALIRSEARKWKKEAQRYQSSNEKLHKDTELLDALLTTKSRALTEAYGTIKAQDERIKAFEQAAKRHSNLEDKELHLLQELQEETKAQKDVIIEQDAKIVKLTQVLNEALGKLFEQEYQLAKVADIISVITKPQ